MKPNEQLVLELIPEDSDTRYPHLSFLLGMNPFLQKEVAELVFHAYKVGRGERIKRKRKT